MRTTNNMLVNNMIYYMGNNLDRMSRYQTQIATGKKITVPSDDPIVAARALKLRTDVSEVKQFKSNTNDAYSWMDTTESTLAKYVDILQIAHERAVQAANVGAMTSEDREKIMKELEQLKGQSIQLANTSYAGRYIFSGYTTDTKLMNEDGTYACSVSSRDTAVLKSGLLDITGTSTFNISAVPPTPNDKFEISVSGIASDYYTVDLADKVYSSLDDLAKDVQDAIRAVAGPPELKNINVASVSGRLEFSLNDTTDSKGNKLKTYLRETTGGEFLKSINVRIEGVPGLAVSKAEDIKYQVGIGDLLNVNVPGTELFGTGVEGQVGEYIDKFNNFIDSLGHPYHITSKGVSVNYSNPLDLSTAGIYDFNITIDGMTKNVGLTQAVYDGTAGKTMDDLARDMQSQINTAFGGTSQVIVENRGGKITMYEKNGKDISLTQGTRDALSVLNFDVNAGAVKSISSQDGIDKAISEMDTLMNKVLSVRADVGARMNRAELTLNRLDSDELNFTKLMSDNEDVDMAEVIMKLKNEENVYNASLAGGARIIMPTLVDFLT